MRKILFRGKRLDNGEWVEGFFYEDADGKAYILSCPRDFGFADSHKVDPATVGECTNIPDKKGELLFEGDIIKCMSSKHFCYVIRFGQYQECGHLSYGKGVGFYCEHITKGCIESLYSDKTSGASFLGDFKKIGNIHDNPEMVAK